MCLDHGTRQNHQTAGGALQPGRHQDCECIILTQRGGRKRRWFLSGQVKESVRVPVVANGDIRCERDIHRVADMTGVDGEPMAQAEGRGTSLIQDGRKCPD